MIFDVGDLRTQLVFLSHFQLMDGEEDWLQIESPFADLGTVDLQQALEEIGNTVCGGAAISAGHVTFRHSMPLENLDINEFTRPLLLVTTTADRLERTLVGGDRY